MLRPTPPGAMEPWPGLLVVAVARRALRALRSTLAPPITTAPGLSAST